MHTHTHKPYMQPQGRHVTLHLHTFHTYTHVHYYLAAGRVVGRATSYEVDDSGFEPRYGGEVFRTRSDGPRGPFNLLQNGYQVSFPEAKRRGVMFTKVKGRVALCLSPALVSSWHITKGTLPFFLTYIHYLPPPPPNRNVRSCSKIKQEIAKRIPHIFKKTIKTNFRTLN